MQKLAITFAGVLLTQAISAATPHQKETVAAVLIAEAGGDGERGMEAVLEVICNRAAAYHMSLEAVVRAPRQFSCLNHTKPHELIARARQHKRWAVALALVSNPPMRNITKAADHYCATWATPVWATPETWVATVGKHNFYRLIHEPKVPVHH